MRVFNIYVFVSFGLIVGAYMALLVALFVFGVIALPGWINVIMLLISGNWIVAFIAKFVIYLIKEYND